MDLQKIKELIEVLAASDLAEIGLIEGEHRVRLIKRMRAKEDAFVSTAPTLEHAAARVQPQAIVPAQPHRQHPVKAHGNERVAAPLYGVLHLTPAPGVATFVQLGDMVQPGQTLCVIEAMKMFHEVKACCTGRIEAILAEAGQEVEAGAELFRLKAVQ
jgi:acetyl-CoA carboxylase biotin carboxyl carrier protein